jgi:hypothetical protein
MECSPLLLIDCVLLGIFGFIITYYSLKLVTITKRGMVNLLAKPKAFKQDVLIFVFASALGVFNAFNYIIMRLTSNFELFLPVQFIGVFIGLLYTIVIVRWARRFKV